MVLGIYGSGGLGREVLENAKQVNLASRKWEDFVFIDDNAADTERNGARIFTFAQVKEMYSASELEISIAVGEPAVRKKLYDKAVEAGYRLATVINPTVSIPDSTEIAAGVTVGAYSLISCNVKIGANAYIQPQAAVGHDCDIGAHSIVSSMSALAGGCRIGNETYIGMGALIKERTSIGEHTIIGMAAAVYKDIGDHVIAVGNPARVVKNNDRERVFG